MCDVQAYKRMKEKYNIIPFHFSSLQLVVLVSERVNSYEKTKANSSTNIWPTDSSLEDDLHVSDVTACRHNDLNF
jgi:hypothetical protein